MTPARILLVEDNATTRRILHGTLKHAGYEVIEAPDARTALANVREDPPDLILQDLMLPDLDGVELTKQIRALPGGSDIPTVILSGFASRLLDPRVMAARYSAWLMKPIDGFELLEAVRAFLPIKDASNLGSGARLLIVDDDPVQLKLARLHFSQFGFAVSIAASAVHALEQLRSKPFDAVLSDVLMPDMDGFELCLEIRRNPRFANIPVILLSSWYQQDRELALAKQSGASALLTRTPQFDGVERAVLDAIARGPGAPPLDIEREQIANRHELVLRRQLDQQIRMNASLARRCSTQASQLCLLGGIADALSTEGDIAVALRDMLASSLDAAAISRGVLYLMVEGRLAVSCAIGYPEAGMPTVDGFFGHRGILDGLVASKLPVQFSGGPAGQAEHREILAKAGMTSAFVVPLIDQGAVIGVLMLGADASDATTEDPTAFGRAIGAHIIRSLALKRAFDRAAISDARYVGLMENSGSAVITLLPDATIADVNSTGERILGVERKAVIGHSLFELIDQLDRDYARIRFEDGVSGGPTGMEVRILRPDRRQATIQINSAVIDAGGERVILAVANDVTERNRLRQQAVLNDKLATVGTLAAGIAHEINNPTAFVLANLGVLRDQLVGIRGLVDGLASVRREPDATLKLEMVQRLGYPDSEAFLATSEDVVRESIAGAERIRDIVKGMKRFARVDETEIVAVDINQAIESALAMAGHEVRQRALLVKDLAAGLPAIAGSRGQLGQVLTNLIVNAAQAIEIGRRETNRIEVRSRLVEGWIRIDVLDTGAGIAVENLPRIFDPFFTTKAIDVGTGLGLSICHEIVRNHGGEISVDSVVGRGTTFSILLPVNSSAPASGPSTSIKPTEKVPRLKLLLVDDEELLLNALKRMIQRNHEVVTASGGRAAIETLKEGAWRFDAILCDVSMPDINGLDLYRYIAKEHPGLERRMVFATGGAFTSEGQSFLDKVPNHRLHKPFTADELSAALARTIANSG